MIRAPARSGPGRESGQDRLKGGLPGSDGVYVEREASSQDSAAAGAATLAWASVAVHPRTADFPSPPGGRRSRGPSRARRLRARDPGAPPRARLHRRGPARGLRGCAEPSRRPPSRRWSARSRARAAWAAPGRWLAAPRLRRMPKLAAPARAPTRPGSSLPRPTSLPALPSAPPSCPSGSTIPRSRVWRLASIPVAVIAVIAGAAAAPGRLGGYGHAVRRHRRPGGHREPAPARDGAGGGGARRGEASFVRESSFSLALPAGWERTDPSGGATFAAAAESRRRRRDALGRADPKLELPGFEARSLDTARGAGGQRPGR